MEVGFTNFTISMFFKTPTSWAEEIQGRRCVGGHKRSASWGSAEHLREASSLHQHVIDLTLTVFTDI